MATREDIRENVYSELSTAVGGLVPDAHVGQEYPESTEDYPTVVHTDDYRRVPMNTNTGPSYVDYSGSTVTYTYSLLMEAQFTVLIASQKELEKEQIYRAVRTHFERFETPARDVSDIHADVYRVEVLDSSSRDDEDVQPIARGDSLTLSVRYERLVEREEDAVESIEQSIDSGTTDTGDGSEDITRTIT
jgi:hypothetical protein